MWCNHIAKEWLSEGEGVGRGDLASVSSILNCNPQQLQTLLAFLQRGIELSEHLLAKTIVCNKNFLLSCERLSFREQGTTFLKILLGNSFPQYVRKKWVPCKIADMDGKEAPNDRNLSKPEYLEQNHLHHPHLWHLAHTSS